MELEHIKVWRDDGFKEASLEMALDHALLDRSLETGEAFARFYTWNKPAITVGYFHEMTDTSSRGIAQIRRYTGGGLVEHGEDLTFTLIFPAGSEPAKVCSAQRYQWIHSRLAESLATEGIKTAPHREPFQNSAQPCFEHAVSEDLIDPETGEKICGGAQRRCRGAVIHQGSLRLAESLRDLKSPWIGTFINALSEAQADLGDVEQAALATSAITLQNERYGTESWNQRR